MKNLQGKRETLLATLYERYDSINAILNRDFLKMDYDEWEIEEKREQLRLIDDTIKLLKED